MKSFSLLNVFSNFRVNFNKIVSILAIIVLMIAAVAGMMGVALANNGVNTTASPNSGTLTVGQTLTVDMTVSLDPGDANPVTSPSCTVNGVDVTNTFNNMTSGTAGHFQFTYTVGASDTDRTAGTVPINCTLHQTGSVTITGFDDGNTVAINASGNLGADTTAPTVSSTNPANNATDVALNSTISATFSEPMNASTLNINSFVITSPANPGSIAGSVQYSGNTATFTPANSLTASTVYTAHINASAQDLAGNAATEYTWTFTTAAASTNSGPGNNAKLDGSSTANLDFPTSASPSSGTLTAGQTLTIQFTDSSNSTTATSTSCLVNGVNTASNFHNVQAGLYQTTYTVGSSDSNATAGNITIDCMINGDQHTIEVIRFNDSNTLAINAGGGGGGSAPTLSGVALSPSSGTAHAGDTITVTLTEGSAATDLAITGLCRINAVDVSSSFHNNNNGTYTVTYTVGANDGERPAGHIPVGCTLGNSGGNVTASAWNDGNTLAIDTNNDGIIDNGTNNLGFTVTASPSSGTLGVGGQLVISMQDPLPSGDVTIVPAGTVGAGSVTVSHGCLVNDVDVSGSYQYFGNGLYKVTYTVGASDTNHTAGTIPFECFLSNHTGTVYLSAFTDNNTVAVDVNSTGGGGGGSPTLTSIAITHPANKLTYTVGESLDISGLVVTGTYSDNSTQVQSITTSNVTGFNSSTAVNNQILTITVNGKTTTYSVNIQAALSGSKSITAFGVGSNIGVINETNHTISLDVPFGTTVTSLTPTFTTTGTGVTVNGTNQVSGTTTNNFTNPVIYRVTAQNGTTVDYTVTVNVLPQGTTVANLTNSSSSVTITSSTAPVKIVIASGTTNPTINLDALITNGTGTLPAITITGTNANNISISIPAGTVVTSTDSSWNGIMTAGANNTTVSLPTISGQTLTLSEAIDLGTNAKLSFSKAIRMLFPGQSGKRIGYVRSGTAFTEITATCASDTQASADSLAADADCKIDGGGDLVVWTKHFTTFATYTQTSNGGSLSGGGVGGGSSGGGGGGGGGGSVNPIFLQTAVRRIIAGCDIRTTGFSVATGESCANNIPNSASNSVVGQVLGASTFKFFNKLKLGMKGIDVTELQNKLMALGLYTGPIDGKFGKLTKNAVIRFQIARGLKGDGIVGPKTQSVLNT